MVMYTLRRATDGSLEGPINKQVYASYAPKRHAFEVALREAEKRGFSKESGKLIQIVTDGDNDLARFVEEYFPGAIHTIDVFHVVEYLWEVAGALYKEGSDQLIRWVESQKEALYDGRAQDIVDELQRLLNVLPAKGPGNKHKRKCLEKVKNYIAKRLDKINYKELRDQDLEISSGAVEGAVKHVIASRFDNGGMRWIKERAEALLQLRCIEINGDWDDFILYVHDKMREKMLSDKKLYPLKSRDPAPLPTIAFNKISNVGGKR